MKIYLKTGRRNHLMIVQPGADEEFQGASWSGFWTIENGEPKAIVYTVQFVDGVAEVESNVGDYLIAKDVAQRTALIRPEIAARVAFADERQKVTLNIQELMNR